MGNFASFLGNKILPALIHNKVTHCPSGGNVVKIFKIETFGITSEYPTHPTVLGLGLGLRLGLRIRD